MKFAHLAEKSMKSSISNLSTRVLALQDQGRGDDCLDLPGRNCGHRRSDVRETEPLSRWKSDHFAPALFGKKRKINVKIKNDIASNWPHKDALATPRFAGRQLNYCRQSTHIAVVSHQRINCGTNFQTCPALRSASACQEQVRASSNWPNLLDPFSSV